MKNKHLKIQKAKDFFANLITYFYSSISVIVLTFLLLFILQIGCKNLSFKMLCSDYYETPYFTAFEADESKTFSFPNQIDVFYSNVWGIGLQNDKDFEGNFCVKIAYIDESSIFRTAKNQTDFTPIPLEVGMIVKRIQILNQDNQLVISTFQEKAENMIKTLDSGKVIKEFYYAKMGGGIRGSLLTTLYLIATSLLLSLPIGIVAAIYLSEYAKNNFFTRAIRTLIDMLSGIPSIIFGLVGVIIFIPFVSCFTHDKGGSILSGACTLAIMLLPVIIRTTEESIKNIPESYRNASFALGASQTQTIFKVVLPNALSGILSATLLSIGRIIGESAALIFAIGTAIQDDISLSKASTSLAVHIWTIMAGENPNYGQACAISLIILIVVLILNILLKVVSKKINRFEVK